MSSPLEQRYRRTLRLLPVGYRHAWEQDMVTSFLQSVEETRSQRLTLGERLSVVWLALRLRLNGSHATPRWALWYHVAYGMGLLVLLYQAVAATATSGYTVAFIATSEISGGPWYAPALLLHFVGLLWVPAFVCLVLRRAVAARILATTAALAVIATTVALILSTAPLPFPSDPGNLSRLGWLLVSTVAAFVVPRGAKASPWLWFGAYLIGSALFCGFLLRAMWPVSRSWSWIGLGNLATLSSLALIAALAVAFVRRRAARDWLIALGLVAGGLGAVRLVRSSGQIVPPLSDPARMSLSAMVDLVLVGLALVALAVGLLGWRRDTARAREA